MRPRTVGGLEPDDGEQRELVDLWLLAKGFAPAGRTAKLLWVVDEFMARYPDAGRKWVYVWSERYLGRMVDPDPVPGTEGQVEVRAMTVPKRSMSWLYGPTNASRARAPRKKRAK